MLKRFAVLILIVASTAARAETVTDYIVRAAAPNSDEGQSIYSWLRAASNGYEKTHMYHVSRGYNVEVESAFINTGVALNPFEMPFVVNGKPFWIPTAFSHMRNRDEVEKRSGGSKPGIYFIQYGYRWNIDTEMLDEVLLEIRVAKLNGTPIDPIEIHETAKSVHSFVVGAKSPAARDLLIPEAEPGSNEYNTAKSLLDNPDQLAALQKWAYYTVKTEAGFYYSQWSNHPYDWIFKVNGKYFSIPTQFDHFDSWNHFGRKDTGSEQGIYIRQGGHRRGYDGVLYAVEASFRMSTLDGTVLPELDYTEKITVEPCPQCLK